VVNKCKARRERKAYERALRKIDRAVAAEKRPRYVVVHPSMAADIAANPTDKSTDKPATHVA
jgi:hypothetical protein